MVMHVVDEKCCHDAAEQLYQHFSSTTCITMPLPPKNFKTSRLNNPHSSSTAMHQGCSSTLSMVTLDSTSRSSIARMRSMLSSLMTYGTRRSRSMISSIL